MKHLLFSAFMLFLMCLSFKSNGQYSWGPWTKTDCMKGIEFRVKRISKQPSYKGTYQWRVEYRNLYNQDVHFTTKAVEHSKKWEIRSSGRTTDRLDLEANGGTDSTWFMVGETNSIYVYINKIRIGRDVYSNDYVDCDR